MTSKAGMPWTRRDNDLVIVMYRDRLGLTAIAEKLERTEHAIHCKLKSLAKMGMVIYKAPAEPGMTFITPIKKELPMNNTVTTKTFVGNKDASELSAEQLLTAIEQEESFIARLSKLKNTSKIDALIEKHTNNSAALVNLLG